MRYFSRLLFLWFHLYTGTCTRTVPVVTGKVESRFICERKKNKAGKCLY